MIHISGGEKMSTGKLSAVVAALCFVCSFSSEVTLKFFMNGSLFVATRNLRERLRFNLQRGNKSKLKPRAPVQ